MGFCDVAVWLGLTWWLSLGFILTVFSVVLSFAEVAELARDTAEGFGMSVLLLFDAAVGSSW